MRVAIIISGILFCATGAFSQVALLDRVYDLIQRRDLVGAQAALQRAEKHITTAHDPRTYYLKAFVGKEMLLAAEKADERNMFRDSIIRDIVHSRELDREREFAKPLDELCDFIAAGLYNEASRQFNGEEFVEAIKLYKAYCGITRMKDNHWLEAKYFIGAAYQSLHAEDSALNYFEFAATRNFNQPNLYVDLAYLYLKGNRIELARKTIDQALTVFPDYYDLEIAVVNILIKQNAYDTLESVVEKLLNKYPDNVEVLLVAGSVYERNRNENNWYEYLQKTESTYQKVIELEAGNFEANYNLGVLYYNEAVDIINKNDIDTDIDELTKVLERSTKLFERALPLLQKIFAQQNDNPKLLLALQAIYYNLNMRDQLAEVNNLIKAGKT